MTFEIVRRSFVEGRGVLAEREDYETRDLALVLPHWSAYAFFMPGSDTDDVSASIRSVKAAPHVSAVACQRPIGTWVRGPRYQLEAFIAAIEPS